MAANSCFGTAEYPNPDWPATVEEYEMIDEIGKQSGLAPRLPPLYALLEGMNTKAVLLTHHSHTCIWPLVRASVDIGGAHVDIVS